MLHVTLRQLQVFESVARLLSYSKAARELHLSQPGVSMQVKQLEEAAGHPLFEQLGKRIFLTEAGREVLRASQGVARQLADLDAALADLAGLKRGVITVGVVSTVSGFAIRLISRFRQRHPEVRITLNVMNREQLLAQLAHNAVDLALMGHPPPGHDLDATPFMENPLVVIASCNHPMRDQRNVHLSRIAEERFVVREPGSGTRSAAEAFFQSRGLALRAAMEMNKNEAIKQAVEVGLGLGIVSLHTVRTELNAGRLCTLDVEDFPIRRKWFLVFRTGKRFSATAQTFADFLLGTAQETIESE